jgi:hypothetical protein
MIAAWYEASRKQLMRLSLQGSARDCTGRGELTVTRYIAGGLVASASRITGIDDILEHMEPPGWFTADPGLSARPGNRQTEMAV